MHPSPEMRRKPQEEYPKKINSRNQPVENMGDSIPYETQVAREGSNAGFASYIPLFVHSNPLTRSEQHFPA